MSIFEIPSSNTFTKWRQILIFIHIRLFVVFLNAINPQQLENPVLIERQWSKRSVNRILKSGLRCGRSSSEHKVLDTRQAKPEKETICFRIATSLVIPYEAYRASACVRISNQKVSRFDIFQNVSKQISTWYFEMKNFSQRRKPFVSA